MKKTKQTFFLSLLLCFFSLHLFAQQKKTQIVVGVVVDQMRFDYLFRYEKLYGENGFKRLLREGYSFENTHYNYFPTVTGCGHASIYTGTTPVNHGIVGNDWYSQAEEREVYCAEDASVKSLPDGNQNGFRSPKNLQCPTITDELRYASPASKVIGLSVKDRSAILPAGHAANWAFWYDNKSGNFISSTFYGSKLPEWLNKFNAEHRPEKILTKGWELLHQKSKYSSFVFDNNPYEIPIVKNGKTTFPYTFDVKDSLINKYFIFTPFANSTLTDLAIKTMKEEKLGKRGETDFLALSYSSTDLIGHYFSTHSLELADCYARLDKDLEKMLNFLDSEYGKGNYLIFLTADHAVAENPRYLRENFKADASAISDNKIKQVVDSALSIQFGKANWVAYSSGEQVYFNKKTIEEKNMTTESVAAAAQKALMQVNGIFNIYTIKDLSDKSCSDKIAKMAFMAAHPHLRSDLYVVLKPQWLNGNELGTTHGSPFAYDTHVPLIFFGGEIPKGKKSVRRIEITDIAPTLALLLHLQIPACTTGEVISEVFE
jgi:predicted AlkP superfamily pyrophosphatase or phosphodiesterase